MSAKVLPFPARREPEREIIIAWFRCAAGCGSLVTSAGALCLRCAVEDR
jgi:hypothetical protein